MNQTNIVKLARFQFSDFIYLNYLTFNSQFFEVKIKNKTSRNTIEILCIYTLGVEMPISTHYIRMFNGFVEQ